MALNTPSDIIRCEYVKLAFERQAASHMTLSFGGFVRSMAPDAKSIHKLAPSLPLLISAMPSALPDFNDTRAALLEHYKEDPRTDSYLKDPKITPEQSAEMTARLPIDVKGRGFSRKKGTDNPGTLRWLWLEVSRSN